MVKNIVCHILKYPRDKNIKEIEKIDGFEHNLRDEKRAIPGIGSKMSN